MITEHRRGEKSRVSIVGVLGKPTSYIWLGIQRLGDEVASESSNLNSFDRCSMSIRPPVYDVLLPEVLLGGSVKLPLAGNFLGKLPMVR